MLNYAVTTDVLFISHKNAKAVVLFIWRPSPQSLEALERYDRFNHPEVEVKDSGQEAGLGPWPSGFQLLPSFGIRRGEGG